MPVSAPGPQRRHAGLSYRDGPGGLDSSRRPVTTDEDSTYSQQDVNRPVISLDIDLLRVHLSGGGAAFFFSEPALIREFKRDV